MAWRIHDHVVRGEIDNRTRGIVRGRIWIQGYAEPVLLELRGNACPDIAGCLLRFENTVDTVPLRPDNGLSPVQNGTIGDLTASRKVRVPDVPVEEFIVRRRRGETPPEHMANCLYLEWFSEANGRVVIESTDCRLDISPPTWRLTPQEEQQRAIDAAIGFGTFMKRLSDAIQAQHQDLPEDREWDEFDYEKFMRESDARTEKYSELMDKFMDHPDRDQIVAREMGWDFDLPEDEEDEPAREGKEGSIDFPDDDGDDDALDPGMDPEPLKPDPATEGIDWIRTAHGHVKHPLSHRALEEVITLMRALDDFKPGEKTEADLIGLVSEFQITSAKLAGALDSLAYGRERREAAFTVAYLKRALGHLHNAQASLEQVAAKTLLPESLVNRTRQVMFELREEILRLMDQFRGRTGGAP